MFARTHSLCSAPLYQTAHWEPHLCFAQPATEVCGCGYCTRCWGQHSSSKRLDWSLSVPTTINGAWTFIIMLRSTEEDYEPTHILAANALLFVNNPSAGNAESAAALISSSYIPALSRERERERERGGGRGGGQTDRQTETMAINFITISRFTAIWHGFVNKSTAIWTVTAWITVLIDSPR